MLLRFRRTWRRGTEPADRTVNADGPLGLVERADRPHREGQPNAVLAQFDAASPVTSRVLLDVLHPPAAWSERPGSSLSAAAPGDLMIASGQGHQSQLRQVDFTVADLESLDADTVLYTDVTGHPRVPSSTFHSVACR